MPKIELTEDIIKILTDNKIEYKELEETKQTQEIDINQIKEDIKKDLLIQLKSDREEVEKIFNKEKEQPKQTKFISKWVKEGK